MKQKKQYLGLTYKLLRCLVLETSSSQYSFRRRSTRRSRRTVPIAIGIRRSDVSECTQILETRMESR